MAAPGCQDADKGSTKAEAQSTAYRGRQRQPVSNGRSGSQSLPEVEDAEVEILDDSDAHVPGAVYSWRPRWRCGGVGDHACTEYSRAAQGPIQVAGIDATTTLY